MPLLKFLTFKKPQLSAAEIIISSFGAFVGISLIAEISFFFTGFHGAMMLIPSMGASAVLVFAVPQGPLSQPWPLIGGNLLSAAVGVSCYHLYLWHWLPSVFITAGLAVGLAIGLMLLTRSLHPPGGASALVAVVGGDAIHALGYQYLLTPVLLNVLVIFTVALIFNNFFYWRRYPTSLNRFSAKSPQASHQQVQLIDKQKISESLKELDLVMDVSVEELQYLMTRTLQKMELGQFSELILQRGQFYSNGKTGQALSVRQIVDESPSENPAHDMVVYRIAKGQGCGISDSCTRQEFHRWATLQVFPTK